MNKQGFTLVELLMVIALLGIVVVIAVPSIAGINNMVMKNMLEKKAELIEEAAILYGEDLKGSIMASQKTYNNNSCWRIIISDLVKDGYLAKDNEEECMDGENKSVGCIVDPSNKNKYMDNLEVILYYKNKRIKAVVDLEDKLVCADGV